MANKWSNKARGIGLPANVTVSKSDVEGYDFVVVDLGSPDWINEQLKPQTELARACGVPVVGVYGLDPKLYVERGSAPWETWDMNVDPNIAKMHFQYYVDRMMTDGIGPRYIHAVMMDGRNIEEGKNVDGSKKYVSAYWWLSVAKYFANVISKRYKLPWYCFMTRAKMELMTGWNDIQNWFISSAGSNSAANVNFPLLADGTPADQPIPQESYIANVVDFWMYDFTGVYSKWIYNGTPAQLYNDLNFKATIVVPPPPPDDDDPVTPPTGADMTAVLAQLKIVNDKLDALKVQLSNGTVSFGGK